jgi:monovalent cation:H+ antiporter-2, CPA2 family
VSEDFIHVGAEIGLLLLGLEYTRKELKHHLRTTLPSGAVDLALNFPPGLIAGLLLGWIRWLQSFWVG